MRGVFFERNVHSKFGFTELNGHTGYFLKYFFNGISVTRVELGGLAFLEIGTTTRSERHRQKHVAVKPVLLKLIYRKTGIILRFWCFLVLFGAFISPAAPSERHLPFSRRLGWVDLELSAVASVNSEIPQGAQRQ
jgi:hypothetical protein